MRLTLGRGLVAYTPEQAVAATGGGSVVHNSCRRRAVDADSCDERSPVARQGTRFNWCTIENC